MLEKIEKFQVLLLGLVIGLSAIVATSILASKMTRDTISVTGSYSQTVTSDRGQYEFEVVARGSSRANAYSILKKQKPVVIDYLKSQGFKDDEIETKYINGYNIYKTTYNGNSTDEIIGFNATQKYSVKSDDVEKIKKVSTDINTLTEQGVDISGYEPSYYYSKLSDLKIEMLEKASKDARQRYYSRRFLLWWQHYCKTFDEVEKKLEQIMVNIFKECKEASDMAGQSGNYVAGANIAAFNKLASAMISQGIV